MTQSPAEEARQFLAANPDVRQIEVIVTAASGAERGTILTRSLIPL